ncbi:hypothetical protein ACQ4PT_011668 [Festuca glaucescens]
MGDNMHEHYLDGEERSMLFGVWHDGSSSSRVSGGYHDSSSPDAWYSSPMASAVAASSRKVAVPAGSFRGRRLNDKLYAIRSVVPNITKVNRSSCIYMRACFDCEMCKLGKTQMDKASIVKDAIEYVRQLQEQERQLLAEMSILESAAPATHGQLLATAERGAQAVVLRDCCAHHAMPPMKKMRSFMSSSTAATPASAMATTSRRIEALEVRVTGVGDKVLLVSVACRHRKEAIAKVCLALDGLRLHIISTNVTSTSGTLKYTALVQKGEIRQSEMKEVIETAIAQVDAAGI